MPGGWAGRPGKGGLSGIVSMKQRIGSNIGELGVWVLLKIEDSVGEGRNASRRVEAALPRTGDGFHHKDRSFLSFYSNIAISAFLSTVDSIHSRYTADWKSEDELQMLLKPVVASTVVRNVAHNTPNQRKTGCQSLGDSRYAGTEKNPEVSPTSVSLDRQTNVARLQREVL